MISLTSSLSIASEGLEAQTGAIAITSNNITNVDTAGYSRQTVNLSADALANGVDNGVSFNGYTSVRNDLLNLSINSKTSDSSSLDTQSTALTTVQTAFSGTTTGIGAALSTFFSSVSSLASNPTDAASRQAVLSSATQLANAFHGGASALSGAVSDADQQVSSTVTQINGLTSQIAALNAQITTATPSGDVGSLTDQRDALTTQLAQLTGISSTRTEGQPTLTTSNGSALVVGSQSYPLAVSTGADGLQHITDSSGNDLTTSLSGGTLGGALTIRDTAVPAMMTQLNTLATQFASAINTAQAAGYDATGATGGPMFTVPATAAAAGISLALTSTAGVAASSDATSGSSGNLTNLLAVQTSTLPSGQTPTDTYASLVTGIGSAASDVATSLTATKLSLAGLTAQQGSISGVSVDEESANLIRFQQAYSASANVIATINTLFSSVMNMTSGGS